MLSIWRDEMNQVHLFVPSTMADWEPAFAIAHINRPMPGIQSGFRVTTVGLDRTPVRSMGGLTIVPEMSLSELDPSNSAMLILPGADVWIDGSADLALTKAKEFVEAGVPVAAICGATFGLARVGLLDSRRHTSNDPGWLASSGYRGAAYYVGEPAVEDQGIITASVTGALEFARLILNRLGVFGGKALEAWYGLYKTGSPECYMELMEALGSGKKQ
jgi:putative intracellular protease/amidase